MKGKKTILGMAAASCLAVTLYATQSRAEWCYAWSWWDDTVDKTCSWSTGTVRAKAGGNSFLGYVDLVDALPRPTGIRWGEILGTDSNGAEMGSCYALDINPAEGIGSSGYDATCEGAVGFGVYVGWGQPPPHVRDEGADARDVSKPLREIIQKEESQLLK
jgi:hypothetical protein